METEIPNEIFTQQSSIIVDNSIESKQYTSFIPQTKAGFNNPSETIEIEIPASDAYYMPSESFLHIRGRLVRANDAAYDANVRIALINNAITYLFSSIEYSLGGKRVETLNYPGHTTSMVGYITYPDDFNSSAGLNQCWRKDTSINAISAEYTTSPAVAADAAITAGQFTPQRNPNYNDGFSIRRQLLMDNDTPGQFSFKIPFSHMFGFGEFKKVLYNLQHTLRLTRGSDVLPIHRANNVTDGKILLSDIRWTVPKIVPSVEIRTALLESVTKKTTFPITFSGRTDQHTVVTSDIREFEWMMNRTAGVEKPRWIIVGFQTNKNTTQEQNPAVFDHVNLTNAFVELNDVKYPANERIINFTTNDYVDFCVMADEFKREHHAFNNLISGTQIDMLNYKKLFPLIVFDVRHQSERVKSNVMSMKLNFKFSENVPANTHMYVVIISDRVIKLTSDGQTPMIVNY